jgi:hypothetical protein
LLLLAVVRDGLSAFAASKLLAQQAYAVAAAAAAAAAAAPNSCVLPLLSLLLFLG